MQVRLFSKTVRLTVIWLITVITIPFLIIACQQSLVPAVRSTTPIAGGELIIGLDGDIQSLDPAFSYDFVTGQVVNQITEPLLKFEGGKRVVPHLAESVENPDPLTYLYKIRQGVLFQDGSPMTIEDVVFSLERIKDPKTTAYTGWMYSNVDRIEKMDDRTLKVTLKQPDAFWQYIPATSAAHIISKAYYQTTANFGKPEGGVMGTGAFKFGRWSTGSEIVLERNDRYWNKAIGEPHLNKIIYKILPEATTRIAGLKTGELNLLLGAVVPSDQIPVIQKMDNVNLTLVDGYLSNIIAFNTQRPPFNNVKLRQAFNYALDKVQITKTLLPVSGAFAKATLVNPQVWTFNQKEWQAAYDRLPDYALNINKARSLVTSEAAALANGKKITTDENPLRQGAALALQAAAKELGITLEIEKVTHQELITRAFSGRRDYDLIVTSWGSDFPDPAGNLLPVFHSRYAGDGGSNFGNYKNPEVDRLLDQQSSIADFTKRTQLMIQAQQIIAEQSIWIVLDYPKQALALSKDFAGYNITPLWYWDLFAKSIYKKG